MEFVQHLDEHGELSKHFLPPGIGLCADKPEITGLFPAFDDHEVVAEQLFPVSYDEDSQQSQGGMSVSSQVPETTKSSQRRQQRAHLSSQLTPSLSSQLLQRTPSQRRQKRTPSSSQLTPSSSSYQQLHRTPPSQLTNPSQKDSIALLCSSSSGRTPTSSHDSSRAPLFQNGQHLPPPRLASSRQAAPIFLCTSSSQTAALSQNRLRTPPPQRYWGHVNPTVDDDDDDDTVD